MNFESLENHQEKCRCCFKILALTQKSVEISKSIEKRFYGLTSIKLIMSDDYSKFICESCNSKLSEFADFQNELVENQLGLYQFTNENAMEEEHLVQQEEFFELVDVEIKHETRNAQVKVEHYQIEESKTVEEPPVKFLRLSPSPVKTNLKRSSGNTTHNWSCNLCNTEFENRQLLRSHMKIHRTPVSTPQLKNSYKERKVCQLCGLSFSANGFYHHNLRAHTEEHRFYCDFCGKGFHIKYDLKEHLNTHMLTEFRQKYPCTHCDAVLLSKSSLKNHEHIFHSQIIEEHLCDCGKIFETRMKLNQHRLSVHTKGHYPCPGCEKVFSQKAILQKHKIRSHSKKEPCVECGKMYAAGMFMTNHMKSHGKPQFKCKVDGCGKEFQARSALLYHNESKHTPPENIKCPSCNTYYTSTRNLNRHIVRQHNPYRVPCEIDECTHTAARKDYLVAHYRSHREIDTETRELLIAKVKDLKVIPW